MWVAFKAEILNEITWVENIEEKWTMIRSAGDSIGGLIEKKQPGDEANMGQALNWEENGV